MGLVTADLLIATLIQTNTIHGLDIAAPETRNSCSGKDVHVLTFDLIKFIMKTNIFKCFCNAVILASGLNHKKQQGGVGGPGTETQLDLGRQEGLPSRTSE